MDTTTEHDTDTTTEQDQPLDKALLFALASILADASSQGIAAMRAEMLRELNERYQRDGTKGLAVRLDGVEVATLVPTFDNGGLKVTDADAFTSWVERTYPDEVEYQVVVRPASKKTLLEKGGLVYDEGTDQVVDAKTGEPAEGVTFAPPSTAPKSFQFKAKAVNKQGVGTDGRARLEEALRDRNVATLMGAVQAAIEPARDAR